MGSNIANQSKTSVTAYSVMSAVLRKLRMFPEHASYFEKDFYPLTQHILNTADKYTGFEFSVIRLFKFIVFKLPDWMQKRVFGALLPGYDSLITARKAMVKSKIEENVRMGATQIVILGGGYCPRGYLTALQYPNVNVFEIDIGRTRNLKEVALENIPGNLNLAKPKDLKNLNLVEYDLTEKGLLNKLEQEGFDKTQQTLFIAEGLTMYLPREVVFELLENINKIMTHTSEILLSLIPAQRLEKIKKGGVLGYLLKQAKEEYKFACNPDAVLAFADGYDFLVTERFTTQTSMRYFEEDKSVQRRFRVEGATPEPYYVFVKKQEATKRLYPHYQNISDVPEIAIKPPKQTATSTEILDEIASSSLLSHHERAYTPNFRSGDDREGELVSRSPIRPELLERKTKTKIKLN
jgi:methyltransferase (TIGR00027 family)